MKKRGGSLQQVGGARRALHSPQVLIGFSLFTCLQMQLEDHSNLAAGWYIMNDCFILKLFSIHTNYVELR